MFSYFFLQITSQFFCPIWFYEVFKREDLGYSKTNPFLFDEFKECIKWWSHKIENKNAWKVKRVDIINNSSNLNIFNPSTIVDTEKIKPEILVKEIAEDLQDLTSRINNYQKFMRNQ